jgi:predicted ribosomally synthesized peptide with nif11-like leader
MMSIHNAIRLLNAIDSDPGIRDRMYQCKDSEQLMAYLESQGYAFTSDELEDAINALHVRCQTLEDAQSLLHKADWLRFMLLMNENTEI